MKELRGPGLVDLPLAEIAIHQQSFYPFPLTEAQLGFTYQAPLASLCLYDQNQASRILAKVLCVCSRPRLKGEPCPSRLCFTPSVDWVRPLWGPEECQRKGMKRADTLNHHTKDSCLPKKVPFSDYYRNDKQALLGLHDILQGLFVTGAQLIWTILPSRLFRKYQ